MSKREELEIRLNVFESLASNNKDFAFSELVRLLKQIAEFRKTNYIEDNDKVLIIVPENYIRKNIFKEIFKGE